MKISKARPIRRSEEVEDEKEQIEETEEHEESIEKNKDFNLVKSELKIENQSNAIKVARGIGGFLSRRKEGYDKWRKEQKEAMEKERIENEKQEKFYNKAERIISSYGTRALMELEKLPEGAKDDILDIVEDFKIVAGKLKDEYRKEVLKLRDPEDILSAKQEFNDAVSKLKENSIEEIIEIFEKLNSESIEV
jgi:hypothetical protein